jgi:hypothetical protein
MTAQTEQAMRLAWASWAQDQTVAGQHVWAVVDASADLPRQVRKALDQTRQVINLFAHRTSDESALALAPRLISVDPQRASSVLKQLWLEQADDEPVVFFVSTAMGEQAFEQAMRKRVRAELPDGDVMLFRWWDARIWWALHQLPQAEHPEVAEFFSAFAASHSLSRDGATLVSTYALAGDDAMAGRDQIKLSSTTFNRLLDLGEADAVLGICREQYPGALDAVLPEQRHALASGQIDWAMAEGFSAPRDHALAVRIAAELGPDWHQQAEWLDLIVGAKAQGRTLLATVEASS